MILKVFNFLSNLSKELLENVYISIRKTTTHLLSEGTFRPERLLSAAERYLFGLNTGSVWTVSLNLIIRRRSVRQRCLCRILTYNIQRAYNTDHQLKLLNTAAGLFSPYFFSNDGRIKVIIIIILDMLFLSLIAPQLFIELITVVVGNFQLDRYI